MTNLNQLFAKPQPIIACIHLPALPGAPNYMNNMEQIIAHALTEAQTYAACGVDGLIIENFGDKPFYPHQVPAETVASMAVVGREIINKVSIPIGINVLRNDAHAALAIANAIGAHFIRINIHMHAVVADQGIIQGLSYETMRLRKALQSSALVFADVGVKHAAPLGANNLITETKDLCERGMVDAIIVSGSATGAETNVDDFKLVKQAATVPILIGSGMTPTNLQSFADADGFIIGSYFKQDGIATNPISPERITGLLSCAANRNVAALNNNR